LEAFAKEYDPFMIVANVNIFPKNKRRACNRNIAYLGKGEAANMYLSEKENFLGWMQPNPYAIKKIKLHNRAFKPNRNLKVVISFLFGRCHGSTKPIREIGR